MTKYIKSFASPTRLLGVELGDAKESDVILKKITTRRASAEFLFIIL